MKLAIAGKGGAGKTTIAGTLARQLARQGYDVLALDNDLNPNLSLTVGLPADVLADMRTMERDVIRRTLELIAAKTGQKPRGWLGPGLAETPNTPDLLAAAGVEYVGDWCADDQPFPMRVKQGRMISVPYAQELNDIPIFLNRHYTPEQFYRFICDQFDMLYAEGERSGRVMAIALHPFITGHPYRAVWLDKALDYVTRHKQVWLTTGGEIADWYYQHYYDQAPK